MVTNREHAPTIETAQREFGLGQILPAHVSVNPDK